MLAIVDAKAVRSIVELAQRLDIHLAGALPHEESELLGKIRGRWDCAIVGAGGKYSRLSPRVRFELLRRVMEGRGLVVWGYGPFPPGNPQR